MPNHKPCLSHVNVFFLPLWRIKNSGRAGGKKIDYIDSNKVKRKLEIENAMLWISI